MDEVHYRKTRRAAETSSAVSSPELPPLQQFSTMDYNTILARCEELEDLGNGIVIARILSKRYRSTNFDFHAPYGAAPNARTIHLLFSTFVNCGKPKRAIELFRSLQGRYPHPIPIDVYTSFMSRLSTAQGKIPKMESVMTHLQRYGPTPTVTMYNMLLRAKAYQEGVEGAEAVMKSMMGQGYSADQQTFKILMDASLKELDMARAYHWLAEYGRQGFEVRPRRLEMFMKTCIQQILGSQIPRGENFRPKMKTISGSNDVPADAGTYSQEWMYKALQVMRYMSSQRITPTAITFELLIEGFLSQQNLAEAKKVLQMMRGSPHLYTPAPRTWTLFFKHYLATNDHVSAFRVLNEMRRVLHTHPLTRAVTVPPTALYHQLFRHLLQRGKLSLAEKSLYEMMIHQNRAQPSEKEVVDLIWKLDAHPAAAERVYELLYSRTEAASSSPPLSLTTESDAESKDGAFSRAEGGSKPRRKNHIVKQGPIQMANVGVMRAKANSKNERLQDEVWKAWDSMIQYFLEKEGDAPEQPMKDEELLLLGESQKERSILALAFEQVAKVTRKEPTMQQSRGKQIGAARESSSNINRGGGDDWDFGQIRRGLGGAGLGLGLGLNPGLGLQAVYSRMSDAGKNISPMLVDATGTGNMNVRLGNNATGSTKHRMLIQQLLKRQEFLQPLLERRSTNGTSTTSDAPGIGGVARNARLESLKSSFVWVQKHGIPVRIEGFNYYLESLISHQDFEATRESVEKYLLSSRSSGSDDVMIMTTPSSLRFCPDVNTLRILNRQNDLVPSGNELIDQVLREGGPDLAAEWRKHLESPRGSRIRQNRQSSDWSTYSARFLGDHDSGGNSSADTQPTPV
ncbi:hypothetical protein EDD21DRAFT_357925 [Dissophora ornata]|nr:hypothetical protein EDD21DRAFT_357925 [Dissophora ornata]